MTFDTRQIIGGSVDDLAEGLRPFIERVFAERLPGGLSWVQVLAHKDDLRADPPRTITPMTSDSCCE